MNKIFAGLKIIAKYDDDFEMCAEHDQVWAGVGISSSLLDEDKEELIRLGWFESEDSWSHFT